MLKNSKHNPKTAMHVGTQGIGTSKLELEFLTRHGVTHMDGAVPDNETETLVRYREEAAAGGVSLDMIHFGLPDSIPLALDPQRDRDIDEVCRIISNAGKAGLRGLNYNFCILPHQRTEGTPGRGGSIYSTFDLSKFDNETLSIAGCVSRDDAFERIGHFLERVIPVAEEYRVQMACHLNDPPAPVLRGVERWNYPMFEGLKRFVETVDSPYNGFNFCCGTAAEGLENPGEQLYEIVQYFGERKKIFNIHFRNIKGGLLNFQEVWPDEGDVDMYRVAQTLHDVGYPYMVMPDHAPRHPDDVAPEGVSGPVTQAWAFQYGYIIAMIQAVSH
jgi:mannonate dehydratase